MMMMLVARDGDVCLVWTGGRAGMSAATTAAALFLLFLLLFL